MTSAEAPYFLGSFPVSDDREAPTLPSEARALWPNEDGLVVSGDWQPGEFRTVSTELGRVAVVGHCLASDETLRDEAQQALETNTLDRLTHLPGNYATITVQPGAVTVFADLAGRRPIYYAAHRGHPIISSRSDLVRMQTGGVVDVTNLAARFACPFVPELTRGQSYWTGVRVLEGGERLSIQDGAGQLVDTYDRLMPDPELGVDEAAAALRAAIDAGVLGRLGQRKVFTADLSGGYDSSTIAARFASLQEGDGTFQASTFFNSAHRSSEGDLDHARRIAGACARLALREVDTAGALPYQDFTRLPHRDEPDPGGLMPGGRDRVYFNTLAQLGTQAHVTGGCGDSLFTPPESYLADLALQRQVKRFLEDGLAIARLNDVAPLEVWSGAVRLASVGIPALLDRFAGQIERGEARTPDTLWGLSHWLALDWLTPAARREIAALARERASQFALPDGMGLGDYYTLSMLRADARTYHRSHERARDAGIEFHTPYLDHQVLRASLNLPAWQRADPRRFKQFLVRAMQGSVPAEVYERQTKGDYSADLYAGLRKAAPQLMQLLSSAALADLGVIEPRKVQDVLDRLSTQRFSMPALNNLVATELWLRDLDSTQLPPCLMPSAPQLSSPPDVQVRAAYAENRPARYVVAPRVYAAAADDGSLIFLNERTRRYYTTSPSAGHILQTLNSSAGDLERAITELERRYPDTERAALRHALGECVEMAVSNRLFERSEAGATVAIAQQADQRRHEPSSEVLAAWNREAVTVGRPMDMARDLGAFVLALALKRAPIRWTSTLLNGLHTVWATREATEAEAVQALASMHRVTRKHILRVACLEESIPTAISLALRRRRVAWHVGAAFDHARPHAWIAVDGKPVGVGKQSDYISFIGTGHGGA